MNVFVTLDFPSGKLVYSIHRRKRSWEFKYHLRKLMRYAKRRRYKRIIVIADNSPVRRSAESKRSLKRNSDFLRVFNLLPYSPSLNEVELVNRQLKRNVCANWFYGNLKDLGKAVRMYLKNYTRQKLRKMTLSLERRVVFTTPVDVFPFYKLADIFCMPSKNLREKGDIEGFGLVFLEAQSYGVPVIGTRSGGISEAVDDGKSGFLVPEEDPDQIKEKILLPMEDEYLYEKMSKYAHKFVKKKFSWERCIDEHIKLYEG